MAVKTPANHGLVKIPGKSVFKPMVCRVVAMIELSGDGGGGVVRGPRLGSRLSGE